MATVYGYARCSTNENLQDINRQNVFSYHQKSLWIITNQGVDINIRQKNDGELKGYLII